MMIRLSLSVAACLVSITGAVAQTGAQAASGGSGFPALQFVTWTEPRENAFSLEVPRGWSVEGGVNWLGPIDAQGFIRMRSPDGRINVFVGDPEILARQVPTQAGRLQAGVPEGQVFRTPSGGPAKLERYMNAMQYAKYHVTWRLCQQPKWVSETDMTSLSQSMAAAVAAEARKYNVPATASSGEVTYTCGTTQGATFATIVDMGHGGPVEVWGVYRVAGFQSSDPLHSMEARYIMEHALASFKPGAEWTNALDKKTAQITGAVISMQNAAVQSALAASRKQNETLARMNHPNAGVPSRSTSGLGGGSSREVNTTLGTARVCDAIGRCSTVSNTSDSYFMDHSGRVRSGAAGGAPPDNSGVWSRLY